jgi:2'-5' RNA ligase
MFYALVHYPDIHTQQINRFRRKYDPQIDLIEPHITLMFPLPEVVAEDKLAHHIGNILGNWRPFAFHLQGLQRSWDGYLFLMIQEGRTSIARLHEEIYTGALSGYRRKDIPFEPHLTLGKFTGDAGEHDEALKEAKRMDLDYHCMMEKLNLVKINDERSHIVWSKEIRLQT